MNKKYIFIGVAVVAAVFLSSATTTVVKGEAQDLLIYLPNGEIDPPYDYDKRPWNIQQHKVEVRIDLLIDENIDTVNLNLFNESNYLVKKKSLKIKCGSLLPVPYNTYNKDNPCERKSLSWVGGIPRPDYPEDDSGSMVIFVFDDSGAIAGNISLPPETSRYSYKIRRASENAPKELESSIILTKIDVAKFILSLPDPEEPRDYGYKTNFNSIYPILAIFFVLIGALIGYLLIKWSKSRDGSH